VSARSGPNGGGSPIRLVVRRLHTHGRFNDRERPPSPILREPIWDDRSTLIAVTDLRQAEESLDAWRSWLSTSEAGAPVQLKAAAQHNRY
jgi:hypothetical protein